MSLLPCFQMPLKLLVSVARRIELARKGTNSVPNSERKKPSLEQRRSRLNWKSFATGDSVDRKKQLDCVKARSRRGHCCGNYLQGHKTKAASVRVLGKGFIEYKKLYPDNFQTMNCPLSTCGLEADRVMHASRLVRSHRFNHSQWL